MIYVCVLTATHSTVETTEDEAGVEVEEVAVTANCALMGPEPRRWHQFPHPHFKYSCLTFLQTCHEVYKEAHHVFYAINTLVFADFAALYDFQKTIGIARRTKLTSVHVLMPIADRHDYFTEEIWEEKLRKVAGAIRMLQVSDLKRLTICSDHISWTSSVPRGVLGLLRGLEEVNLFFTVSRVHLGPALATHIRQNLERQAEEIRALMMLPKPARERPLDLFQLLHSRKRDEKRAERKRKREEESLEKAWRERMRPKWWR